MPTYKEIAERQLRRLTRAFDLEAQFPHFRAVTDFLLDPWGDRQVPRRVPWASNIGDDHSPYEFSLAFEGPGAPELRLLVEAQAERPGLVENHAAALALTQRLKERFGVDLERFDRIADLFFPEAPQPPFTLWHAVCLPPDGKPPAFKAYFNPLVRGPDNARRLVEEALDRLGFSEITRPVVERCARRRRDIPSYFSLDLSHGPRARVKLYHMHPGVTAADLEALFTLAPTHQAGDVLRYLRALVGTEGPFDRKPITSCFAFVEGARAPHSVTLHLPIAHYLADDRRSARRITTFLGAHDLPAPRYADALAAMARRPLARNAGIQSYASFRRDREQLRLTVYLSPELFRGDAAHHSALAEAS